MAQTTTQTGSIPGYIQQPTQQALGDINSWLQSGSNYVYGSKPGERLFTPLSTGQNKAIGNINWLSDQNLPKMLGLDQGRLVDENGSLGKIGDYMNPYMDEVLAPQIRELEESLQRGRRDLGAGMTMAGAFGDARHGVNETGLYDATQQNIADVTGRAHADAWNNAMGMRSADRDNFTQQGQLYLKNFLDVNDALFNAGQVQRDASEEQRQATENFQTALKDKRYNDALKLLGAVRGTPYTTTTTSKQESDDGMWGLIGSALGGLFG